MLDMSVGSLNPDDCEFNPATDGLNPETGDDHNSAAYDHKPVEDDLKKDFLAPPEFQVVES